MSSLWTISTSSSGSDGVNGYDSGSDEVCRSDAFGFNGPDIDDGVGETHLTSSSSQIDSLGSRLVSSFAVDSPYSNSDEIVFTAEGQKLLISALCGNSTNKMHMCDEVMNLLSEFLNTKTTVTQLGNGSNSSAFLIRQNKFQNGQVLRLFSFSMFQKQNLLSAFSLTNKHIGGEWLSTIVDDTKVSANTHLIIWDREINSFRIIDRQTAKELIENSHNMQENGEIFVIGTIGEYAEGSQDLEQVLREKKSIGNQKELKTILQDLFTGVASLHEQDICHRDLKLSNIIILPSGRVRVIDFGSSARQIDDKNLSRAGDFCLQPYESIVQYPCYTNKKTDSYSLFRLTYHLVTGEDFYPEAKKVQDMINSYQYSVVFTPEDLEKEEIDREFIEYMKKNYGNVFKKSELNVEIIKFSHRKSRELEERVGMKRLLQNDPKLTCVDERLIDLMAAFGTSFEDRRLYAVDAMQLPYFNDSSC